jgi:hypothetical protein
MKDYIGQIDTSLVGNTVLNPAWPEQVRNVADIQRIIVHHEAQEEGTVYDDAPRYEAEAQYQNNVSIPGSKGLQYHFKIDNVGQIFQIRPFNITTWHAGNLPVNNHSIAVCLDGNFEVQQPTREQFESLKQLLDWLSTQHPEFPAVQGDVSAHSEVIDHTYFPGGTACCGANLRPYVIEYRTTGGNPSTPDVPYQHPELQASVAAPVVPPAPVIAEPAPVLVAPVEPVIVEPVVPPAPPEPVAPVITVTPVPDLTPSTPVPIIVSKVKHMPKYNLHQILSVATYVITVAAALVGYLNSVETVSLLGLVTVLVTAIERTKLNTGN